MKPPTERQALQILSKRLADLFGLDPSEAKLRPQPSRAPNADALVDIGGFTFVVEWKGTGTIERVSDAVRQVLRHAADVGKRAIPLVAVPFMGPAGRELCEEARVGWLDLSGNAHLVAPGLRVRIDGQPNLFKHPGRPSSAFAPKSSRIARWLLQNPHQVSTQREIATATEMDEGFTSRIVARLEADGFIVRDAVGRIRVADPNLLLDAWSERYEFSKHQIVRGHVSARSGESQLQALATALAKRRIRHAATGLAAAWLLSRFAGFRIVTLYLAALPEAHILGQLGFRESASGANTWLVIPNDEGVFQGSSNHEGVECVHAVQAYLDLQGHPERAKEAAEQLRKELLNWSAGA